MYSGKELWKGRIPFELRPLRVSGSREIETYPGLPASLYEALVRTAGRLPEKMAAEDDCGHDASYAELLNKVDVFASFLKERYGIGRGSRAAMMMYNSLEFCVVLLALNKLGACVIPLQTKYRKPEIESLLTKAEADLIITDPGFQDFFGDFAQRGTRILVCGDIRGGYGLAGMEGAPCEAEGGRLDDALLIFTSGTTARSKGVVLKNFNVMHAVASYQLTLGIGEGDRAVIPIPLYLITGMVAVMGLLFYVGGTVFIQQFFDASHVLDCVRDKEVTFLHASPTVFSLLLGVSENYPSLPSLKKFACGSSNMPKEKIRQLHRWLPGCAFHTVYGLTETASPGTVFPEDAAESPYIGSSGIPIPGMEVRIMRDDGGEAAAGEVGEVMLRGANLLDSYYRMETPLLRDNWLATGDLGYVNAEGYLFIVDRRKDMINRGGEKVCSFDVENEIYQIEGVVDAAVVAVPDEMYGEVPAAVIRARPGFAMSGEEIRACLKTRLASYQVPAKIRFVEEIPVTPNGKVDKKYIRTLF